MYQKSMDLENYATRIAVILEEFFDTQKSKVDENTPSFLSLLEVIQEFSLRGGKRIRPFFVYIGYSLIKGDISEELDEVMKASILIELIHTFFLAHDDIMDKSDLRRGKPTLHVHYEKEYKSLYGNNNLERKHFGSSMAILAGDMLFSLALDLLSDLNIKIETQKEILRVLNKTIMNTIVGQELDIRLEHKRTSFSEEILNVYKRKTAQYTFECPLHLGVLLAEGTERDLKILSEFAIPLGIAFQIRDDILGVFGKEKETGKIVGDDIYQGKQTLLIAKALEYGSDIQKDTIISILGNKNITHFDIRKIQTIIEDTGALTYAQDFSQKKIAEAKKILENIASSSQYNTQAVTQLSNVTDYIISRSI